MPQHRYCWFGSPNQAAEPKEGIAETNALGIKTGADTWLVFIAAS